MEIAKTEKIGDNNDSALISSQRQCRDMLYLKDLGNWHRVEIKNGKVSCTCQSFMTWATCYDVKEFGIIANKTYPEIKYVKTSGENWDKVQENLITKLKEKLLDNILSKNQKTIIISPPKTGPQGPFAVCTNEKDQEDCVTVRRNYVRAYIDMFVRRAGISAQQNFY